MLPGWWTFSLKPDGPCREERPAERDVRGLLPSARQVVPAGENKLKLIGPRLAEDGRAQPAAPGLAVVIVLELLDEPFVPVRIEDALEDVEQDRPLILRVEIGRDERLRDRPEVRHVRPQQSTLGMLVIPIKADGLLLVSVSV